MHKNIYIEEESGRSLLFVDFTGSFGVLDRDRKGLGFLVLWSIISSADQRRVALDDDTEGQDGRSQNDESHEHESSLVFEVAESKSEADSSSVSSSSDNSRDGTSGRRVNVWDNTVGGTLGGLDEEGEEDHDGDGGSKRLGLGKDQNENTFSDQAKGMGNNTSTHSHVFVSGIGEESSKTTGEQVHESENGGDGGSRFGGELENFLEVKGGSIVHGQFNTEAASVLDEKNPGVEVEGSLTEGGSGRDIGHLSVLL